MNTKNELNEIFLKINNLLNEYIVIHDEVFKFSWRKIIPLPFIFKAINFHNLQQKAEEILNELEQCNNDLNKILSKVSDKESRCAHFLSEYCLALTNTVSLLNNMLHQLYLKSENSGDYNLSKHNSLSKEYDEAVQKYYGMGNRLNELYKEFNQ
jgi:phage-related minor tail protein